MWAKIQTAMAEHTVMVWGKRYTVSASRQSKSVWRALGEYEGQWIETKGRTEGAAVIRWREAAHYRGNG
jgi:hypothetical protein